MPISGSVAGIVLADWPDVLFWAILGSLVVATLSTNPSTAGIGPSDFAGEPPGLAVRASTVAGTFATICVLWSLWTSESLDEWLSCCARSVP